MTDSGRPQVPVARALAPPQGPALGHAATVAALVRYRRRSVTMLLVGVMLLAGFAVAVNVVETRAADLLATGATARGVVRTVQGGRIVVSFSANGQVRQATIHLDSRSPTYQAGQAVTEAAPDTVITVAYCHGILGPLLLA